MRRARSALASLPWADEDSIQADVGTKMVSFSVPDKTQYDEEQLLAAFQRANFSDTKVMRSPAEEAEPETPID